MYKQFLKNYIYFLSAMLLLLLLFIYLKNHFEHNTYEEIVNYQLKHDGLYGTAINQNTFSYKLELIKKQKPEVIALGSSRVMQFRDFMFNKSFVNAGGAMNHLNEGLKFVNLMLNKHKPKYVILGLDFWWFNDKYKQPNHFSYHENQGNNISYYKVKKFINLLYNNKINLKDLTLENNFTKYKNLGFQSYYLSNGFRKDGSYLYGSNIFGLRESSDIKFNDTLSRVKIGDRRFQYGDNYSLIRYRILQKIISVLELNNIQVILFIPPISSIVLENMDNKNYSFINKFTNNLLNDYNVIDYHNYAREISKNDCEFVDGFHSGDILIQRILLNEKIFSNIINRNILLKNIKQFKGYTVTPDKKKFNFKEIDFLKLGCDK